MCPKCFWQDVQKPKKHTLFTMKHPIVLKIALKSWILVWYNYFRPHFSCLPLYLFITAKSYAEYFWQGVQKPEKHIFSLKHPIVLKIALKTLILVTDKCFAPHLSCLTLYQKILGKGLIQCVLKFLCWVFQKTKHSTVLITNQSFKSIWL